MSAFHPTTVTILKYVLDEQRRDLAAAYRRLERADVTTLINDTDRERFPKTLATLSSQIVELTAVCADLTELLRLIGQANDDAAIEDRQITAEEAKADRVALAARMTNADTAARSAS